MGGVTNETVSSLGGLVVDCNLKPAPSRAVTWVPSMSSGCGGFPRRCSALYWQVRWWLLQREQGWVPLHLSFLLQDEFLSAICSEYYHLIYNNAKFKSSQIGKLYDTFKLEFNTTPPTNNFEVIGERALLSELQPKRGWCLIISLYQTVWTIGLEGEQLEYESSSFA